jgi:hypothetical protein
MIPSNRKRLAWGAAAEEIYSACPFGEIDVPHVRALDSPIGEVFDSASFVGLECGACPGIALDDEDMVEARLGGAQGESAASRKKLYAPELPHLMHYAAFSPFVFIICGGI